MCQTVKAFLPEMMSRDSGHIVTVSSAAAMFGVNGLGDYCASKAAAAAFHESVRAELYVANKTGVHMTLICPVFINTGMFDGCKSRLLTCLCCRPTMPKSHNYDWFSFFSSFSSVLCFFACIGRIFPSVFEIYIHYTLSRCTFDHHVSLFV